MMLITICRNNGIQYMRLFDRVLIYFSGLIRCAERTYDPAKLGGNGMLKFTQIQQIHGTSFQGSMFTAEAYGFNLHSVSMDCTHMSYYFSPIEISMLISAPHHSTLFFSMGFGRSPKDQNQMCFKCAYLSHVSYSSLITQSSLFVCLLNFCLDQRFPYIFQVFLFICT